MTHASGEDMVGYFELKRLQRSTTLSARRMLSRCFSLVLIASALWLIGCSRDALESRMPDTAKEPTDTNTTSKSTDTNVTPSSPEITAAPKISATDPRAADFKIQTSSETLPWLPPRRASPIALELLPPGCQAVIVVRPAAWLNTKAGRATVDVLASELEPIQQWMAPWIGDDFSNLDNLVFGLYPGGQDGWPLVVVRAQWSQPVLIDQYVGSLPQMRNRTELSRSADSNAILDYGDRKIYLRFDQKDRTKIHQAVIGPGELIDAVASNNGEAPLLRRQLEQLRLASDAQADFTILCAPSFLFTDGRALVPSIVPQWMPLVTAWLSRDMQAVSFSTSLSPNWYGELRLIPNAAQDAPKQAERLQAALTAWSQQLQSGASNVNLVQPSAQRLLDRFPRMIQSLVEYQRTGVENGHIVCNFYLPAEAAPNLIVAVWLAGQKSTALAMNQKQSVDAPESLSIDDLLARPVDISFDQESLEFALAAIAESINRPLPPGVQPIRMEIIGAALEKDGITRNQQVRDFQHRQSPLRDVLTDLVRRANPIANVDDLSAPDQKLVWIVRAPKTSGEPLQIRIATRSYVSAQKIELPREFKSAP